MRRTFLLLACGLLAAAVAFAQSMSRSSAAASAQYQNPEVTTAPAISPAVIRGCLSGSSGNYTLTDQNGMQYQVTGDDATLRSMVGREVEITGLENPGEASSRDDETTSYASNAVQASEVRAVSSSCNKGSSVGEPPRNPQ